MNEDAIRSKEKKNKKLALVVMIILCAVCLILGGIGGVLSFISFIDNAGMQTEENTMTPIQQEFSDGVLNIMNESSSIVGTYKCENTRCGYAYGYQDDSYDLKAISVPNDYQMRNLFDDQYVLLYDDDENDDTLHRKGVILYNYATNTKEREFDVVKTYNKPEINYFIARENTGLWAIIGFDENGIRDVTEAVYDYIGIFLPENESVADQNLFATFKSNVWSLVDVSTGTTYSTDFEESIYAYDGELVVTKNGFKYNLYDVHGNKLFTNGSEVLFPGAGLLIIRDDNNVTVYDAYAIEELFSKDYSQIRSFVAQQENEKIVVKVNDEDVYTKENLVKSPRNKSGARFDLIIDY